MTRLAVPPAGFAFDTLRPLLEQAAAAEAPVLSATLPTARQPVTRVAWRDKSGSVLRCLDPATGAVLPESGKLAGTHVLYPFHYMLHIRPKVLGLWVVGATGFAMLILCASGVVMHRKIFADFFTFRANKRPRRLVLNLYNVTGVFALAFYVVITLSGLMIFFATYFPSCWQIAYPDINAFAAEIYDNYSRSESKEPGQIASSDVMVETRSASGVPVCPGFFRFVIPATPPPTYRFAGPLRTASRFLQMLLISIRQLDPAASAQ